MADEEATVEADVDQPRNTAHAPLVSVTFQKNPARARKYLDSEPKALGITQITLSVFQISWVTSTTTYVRLERDVPLLISSFLVIIAGSLAMAAQNLHLPTLKACLGLQVMGCVTTSLSLVFYVPLAMEYHAAYCWNILYEENVTVTSRSVCQQLQNADYHRYAENILIHAALIAISATLAAYCCKVVNCCSPTANMPVITVQAPPAQHRDP
ncbi:uncharacterized protein LOC130130338 [Lampris incognitus]|uniref:uncharacterized protein LOC130130338 n=1 Tax=Lampris incognitus TaxID=2546036 RepID=UPI0024B49F87|nr:uncharacterized protein LOC130130338 [Lampris incognitus]